MKYLCRSAKDIAIYKTDEPTDQRLGDQGFKPRYVYWTLSGHNQNRANLTHTEMSIMESISRAVAATGGPMKDILLADNVNWYIMPNADALETVTRLIEQTTT